MEPLERFIDKVRFGECWIWEGKHLGSGKAYGGFFVRKVQGKAVFAYAHRWAYEQWVSPIPRGTEIDHLCRETLCVRPEHLEAVTHRENVLRGESLSARRARVTHCPNGHEYTEGNTYISSKNQRHCRTCEKNRAAAKRGPRPPHYRTLLTHCKQGHPFEGDNLVIRPNGNRACRTCRREAQKRWEAKAPEGLER